MKNLSRRLSELQQYTRNPIHDLSDFELDRRIKDIRKREYAISTVEELEAEVKEIEAIILKKRGFYGGGTKELLERIATEETDCNNPKPA